MQLFDVIKVMATLSHLSQQQTEEDYDVIGDSAGSDVIADEEFHYRHQTPLMFILCNIMTTLTENNYSQQSLIH